MKKNITLILILFLASCASVRKLPKEYYYAFLYYFDRAYKNDTISFHLKNPLMCPINVKLAKDTLNPDLSNLFGHVSLAELQDTIIKIHYPAFDQSDKSVYVVKYGDPEYKTEKNKIALPFPKGKEYRIIQGYNGAFTHNTIFSRFAIDFNLDIGDTITAADDGYVVGVIEDYKTYGTSKKWLEFDKSNYITVYHPQSGLFTQYVHLDHKGALIKLGDHVKRGQAIGICGMTGFTTTPHLHFNVKVPTKEHGLISTEIEFENGIRGKDLKQKDYVK